MTRSLIRALVVALVAALLIAPSTSAASVILDEGRTGVSMLKAPNAYCYWRPANLKLKFIRIRPPTVYSDYAAGTKSWVGWRARVYRATLQGENWTLVKRTAWQKDRATKTVPADGFKFVDWAAPKNPTGRFRVEIVVAFYKPGSKKKVEGRVVWALDNFVGRYVGQSGQSGPYGDCVAQD